MKLEKFIVIMIFFLLAEIGTSNAEMITCNSCSENDVLYAIDKSKYGDVVIIPSGNCSWENMIKIPIEKKITLTGKGVDSTFINGTFDLGQSGSRVTGISFDGIKILVDGDGWRIDHCKFTNGSGVSVRGLRKMQHPTGVIDNCTFENSRVVVGGYAGLMANDLWTIPVRLGDGDNVVYVEDCSFTHTIFGNAIDANYGGAYVFRYNTLNGPYIESHSVQAENRATRRWEIYGNLLNNTGNNIFIPFFLRGGTGVVFGNMAKGNFGRFIIGIDNVRSFGSPSPGGACDGSSGWDGNFVGEAGYPCRDQIGRGQDSELWVTNPLGKYTQVLLPAYAWMNRNETNNEIKYTVLNGCETHIKEERDYYNFNANFDGSSGVGCGKIEDLPENCEVGVAYWATNQSCANIDGIVGLSKNDLISGTLYKCTKPNEWEEYFTPYTYPHPLRMLIQPSNLKIVEN